MDHKNLVNTDQSNKSIRTQLDFQMENNDSGTQLKIT